MGSLDFICDYIVSQFPFAQQLQNPLKLLLKMKENFQSRLNRWNFQCKRKQRNCSVVFHLNPHYSKRNVRTE